MTSEVRDFVFVTDASQMLRVIRDIRESLNKYFLNQKLLTSNLERGVITMGTRVYMWT